MKRRPLAFPLMVVLVSAGLLVAMVVNGPRGGAGPDLLVAGSSPQRLALAQLGVYMVARGGAIQALNADSGQARWSLGSYGALRGLPALADGALYLSVQPGSGKPPALYALDAGGGQMIWRQTAPFSTMLSAPVVVAGTVFAAVGTPQGGVSLVALNEKDGTFTSLALADAVAPVLLAVNGGTIAVVAASSTGGQSELFTVTPGSPHVSHPMPLQGVGITRLVAANGVVYVTDGRSISAINATNGTPLWHFAPGSPSSIEAKPAVSGGMVYFSVVDTTNVRWLYAVSATTGEQTWKVKAGTDALSTPAVANGSVYVATDGQVLYAVNAHTGAVLRRVSVDASASIQPVIAVGVVFVGAEDGTITALRADGGSMLWKARMAGGLSGITVG